MEVEAEAEAIGVEAVEKNHRFHTSGGDHVLFCNLFNVTSKNLGMFNVNLFCHIQCFFAHCFCLIVEFYVLRKQKQNKLPTTTTNTTNYY